MPNFRCLSCGSSKWDSQGVACARCGLAMGPRRERLYISENTQTKLLDYAVELSKFGIKLEQQETLQKSADTAIAVLGLAISVSEALSPGSIRQLIIYLRDKLLLPENEILRLRLDEPEEILTYYRADKNEEQQ